MTHRLFGFCESPFRRHVNFLEREGDPLPKPPAATRLICLCVASMWILEPMPTLEFFWFLFLWAKNGRVRERWRVVAVCSHQRCAWGTRATAHTRRPPWVPRQRGTVGAAPIRLKSSMTYQGAILEIKPHAHGMYGPCKLSTWCLALPGARPPHLLGQAGGVPHWWSHLRRIHLAMVPHRAELIAAWSRILPRA